MMTTSGHMPLGNVVRFGNGKAIKPGGTGIYPVYGSNGIIGGSDEFRHENGVVIGRVGAYCGSVVYCPTKFWASDNTLVAYPASENVDTKFLYYLLADANLSRYAGGAAQPLVTQTVLKQVEVQIPPLPIQRRIAGILSAYDELIENSQRRIKILESMARGLYREWFVHFRFPGHESVPRVPSPMGEIPKGWEVKPFGDLYNTSSGGTPSRKRPEYFEGGSIDWVKSQELLDKFILTTEERITPDAIANSSAKMFPPNTVLVALYGATIGMLAILSGEAATNQACCAVLPKSSAYGREFAFLTLLTNRERIIGLRLGAAQQNISQVLLRNFECIKPPTAIATQFAEHVSPLFDGILNLQLHIQNLRRTRELLLPRLMTGQINLEDSNG
jgi:type I restriction enzyme S subunit